MNTEREIDQLPSSYEIMFDDESGSFTRLSSWFEDYIVVTLLTIHCI